MSDVRFAGISKAYGEVRALHPLDLDIRPGEFLTLLGPSGSGKTTLLNICAGYLAPSGGRLLVGGRDVTGLPPRRRNMGMVFQNYALFPHMSVAENVAYGLTVRRLPGIEHDVGDPLPGGDEVGVGLDPAGRLAVAEALAEGELEAGGDAAGPRRQDDEMAGEQHRLLDAVGDHQDGLAGLAPELEQLLLHLLAGQRIERAERLVHQQHAGVAGQRAGQPDPLAHAAGELPDAMALEARQPDQPQGRGGALLPLAGQRPREQADEPVRQGRRRLGEQQERDAGDDRAGGERHRHGG